MISIPVVASIIVPTIIYLYLPKYAEHGHAGAKKYRWLLIVGCFLYFISWYLPVPIIDGMETGFWTHFIGGGVFTGFLWLYLVKTGFWKVKEVLWEIVTLYALVSSLGVLNELAEFGLFKVGLFPMGLADTSWDLVTNTSGAALFYIVYKTVEFIRK
jgi:hypothetical protein